MPYPNKIAVLLLLATCLNGQSLFDNQVGKSPVQKRVVTWPYLRAMARFGNNPQVTRFLKDNNQLIPKYTSGTDCGTNPWEDTCDPVQVNDHTIVSMRVDIPFQLNGQTAWLSTTTLYRSSIGEVLLVGSTVYGAIGNTNWRNYAPPVASYSNHELTIINNLTYSSSANTSNTYAVDGRGYGELSGTGVTIDFPQQNSVQTTMTQTGILFNEMTLMVSDTHGKGVIQLNGVRGPKVDYTLTRVP